MRMLNKFNKSLIDENISTFYSKFIKNNTELPKLDTYNMQLCDIIKTTISNYHIEILRQSEIANLPRIDPIKQSALKGFQHFKKTLKLRNIGILNNFALSNENGDMKLFYDTHGANTSLVDFGSDKHEKIEVKKLDSLNLTNIKLLKIDAEGFEPEVLDGAKETLKEISYIAIDYGNERGVNEDSTMVEVLNLLYENNFTLIKDSKYRKVGLFRNNSHSKWTSLMYSQVEEKKA